MPVVHRLWLGGAPAAPARRWPHAPIDVAKRQVIEDPRGRVTHVFHRQPHATCAFVDALDAFNICGPADARDQRQRPLEDANDFTDGNAVRPAPQEIASALPFSALHQAVPFEVEEDRLEKLPRHGVAGGQIGDQHGLVAGVVGQQQ